MSDSHDDGIGSRQFGRDLCARARNRLQLALGSAKRLDCANLVTLALGLVLVSIILDKGCSLQ